MGIYLPDMGMPKPGEVIRIYNNGEARRCRVTEQEAFEVGIAFPVPPHGRLGDLDEIVRYKERLVVDADKINPAIRYVVDTKYIEGTPTIIPAEEDKA